MIHLAIQKALAPLPTPSLELCLAQRLLAWLQSQTLYTHYYDALKALRGLDNYDVEHTRSLRFNLWMRSDACLWPAPYQVKSSNDLTWQWAIIEASKMLNEVGR